MKKLIIFALPPLLVLALAAASFAVLADTPERSIDRLILSRLLGIITPEADTTMEPVELIENREADVTTADESDDHREAQNDRDGDRVAPAAPIQTQNNLVLPPQIADFDPVPRPATSLGDPDAPVVMVEWSDYICPYCADFADDIFPKLKADYIDTGKLYFVYKDYPAVGGDLSFVASLGAQCAAEQDKFWEMNRWLFGHQADLRSAGSLEDLTSLLTTVATDLNLDEAQFGSCMAEQTPLPIIAEDYQEGQRYRARGTPNFIINGHMFQGMLPPQQFMQIVDALVAEAETGALPDAVVEAAPPPVPSVDFLDENYATLGDPEAPVVIVEYTDYQCPYCRKYTQETFPELLAEYIERGDVYYTVKDFPLYAIHPQAVPAAAAAECAGAQNAYWEMHDLLFEDQQNWSGKPEATELFVGYATDLGLDITAFTSCMISEAVIAEIAEDLEGGVAAGVEGTPAFFINDEFVSGALPLEAFQQLIEVELE